MQDLLKLLQEALGGVATGRTVITAGSKEELLAKVKAAMEAEESDQEQAAEDDAITQIVEGMNPKLAAEFATAGLLSATREFDKGHFKCASYKMNASAVWLALSEHLLAIEKWEREQADRREGEAMRSQLFEQGWADARTPEQKAAQEREATEVQEQTGAFSKNWLTGESSSKKYPETASSGNEEQPVT